MKRTFAFMAAIIIASTTFAQNSTSTETKTSVKDILKEARQQQQEERQEEAEADKTAKLQKAAAQFGTAGSVGAASRIRPMHVGGLIAGFTSSSTSFKDIASSPVNQFHVGLVTRVPLFLGFSLEPAIMYNMKGTVVKDKLSESTIDTSVGYLEVPVQLQWGIRIKQVKPYVFAEPFVGYALNTKTLISEYKDRGGVDGIVNDAIANNFESIELDSFKDQLINRLEYGVGIGAGVELFNNFQIMGKYFMNMGNLYNEEGKVNNVGEVIKNSLKDQKSFNGFSLSLALFF